MLSQATLPPPVPAAADRHFRTEHLNTDLKGRSVRGGVVTLAAQAAKFVLQMGATAVLARLLTPTDFGLVAMVATVTGFASLFKDLGLSTATVQRTEITHDQVSVLFWINVAVSVILMVAVGLMAPGVAWFYGEPRLIWVTVTLAGTFIFGGLAAQHTALLQRQMRFVALATIDVGSIIAGITAAIALGLLGASYWALVANAVVASMVTAVGVWIAVAWRPSFSRRGSDVLPMLKFGGNLTGFNLLNYFARNADNILIGKFSGAGPLGLYSRAYNLLMLPLQQINAPVGSVAIPALSRLQHDPVKYRHFYCKTINTVLYVACPTIVILAVLSDEIIYVVLGTSWSAASPIFRILAIAAIGQPLLNTVGWIYLSLGQTGRMVRWGLFCTPCIILSFLVGLPWGLRGIATSYAVCVNLLIVPGLLYAYARSPIRTRDAASAIWRPALITLFLFVAMSAVRWSLAGHSAVFVISGTIGSGALLVSACTMVWAGFRDDLRSLLRLVTHMKHRPDPAQ